MRIKSLLQHTTRAAFATVTVGLVLAAAVPAHAQTSWMDVQLCKSQAIQNNKLDQVDSCYKKAGKNEHKWRNIDANEVGGVRSLDNGRIDSFRALRRGFEPADRSPIAQPNQYDGFRQYPRFDE